MQSLTDAGSDNPFNFQSTIGDILKSIGASLSLEQMTIRMLEKQTKELRKAHAQFDSLSERLGELDRKDLERTRKLLKGSIEIFELAHDHLASSLKDEDSASNNIRLLHKKENHLEELAKLIDKFDDILISINLISDKELPSILEKVEQGNVSDFIPRQ